MTNDKKAKPRKKPTNLKIISVVDKDKNFMHSYLQDISTNSEASSIPKPEKLKAEKVLERALLEPLVKKPPVKKIRAKKTNVPANIYAFPNVLNGRNLNSKLNSVWAMDFTYLDVSLEGKSPGKHYCFVVVDHCTRKCILCKVFYLPNRRGTIKSTMVIKMLKKLIELAKNPGEMKFDMRKNESKQAQLIDLENEKVSEDSEDLEFEDILQMDKQKNLKLKYELQNLQKTIPKKYKLGHPLILHTDNGVEFVSKEYSQFIHENPELIGSTSPKGKPTQNTIAERFHRVLKSQRKTDADTGESFEFPKVIKTTQQLQTLVDRKINYLNDQPNDYNFGASPNEYEIFARVFEQKNTMTPNIFLTKKSPKGQTKTEEEKIVLTQRRLIRYQAPNFEAWTKLSSDKLNYQIQNISEREKQHFLHSLDFKDEFRETSGAMLNIMGEVLYHVKPKPKKPKSKPNKLRCPITYKIFKEILQAKRPKRTQRISWARFRVAIVILFFTGLRAGEVGFTTHEMINSLRKNQKAEFYQPKTNSQRICYISNNAQQYFDLVQQDIQYVFSPLHKIPSGATELTLYPSINMSQDKWLKLLNDRLRPYGKKYGIILTSHSFRISFINRIIKTSSIDRAQKFVGHKDIRSTESYNRYQIGDKESLNILNKSFEDEDFEDENLDL
jgi:transposase InsO family protein/integrase